MHTPQDRVEAYIQDWHQSWKDYGGGPPTSAAEMAARMAKIFEEWRQAIDVLTRRHWTAGSEDESGSHFGDPPDHDPAVEAVRRTEVNGDTAIVETEVRVRSFPKYYEYRLKKEGGSWRISSMIEFHDDEDDASFSAHDAESLLRKVSSTALPPPPEKGDEPNCEILFKEGHAIKGSLMRQPEAIKVRKMGKLSLPSGIIVARDFGYAPDDARPLSLRVNPGDYDVEVCLLDQCVAAVRIVFEHSEDGPFVYRRAVTVGGDDSCIGVDAGNVSLCDARAYMMRSKREHTRDQEAWKRASLSNSAPGNRITFLKLSGSQEPTAVIVNSGHGDGVYPAFWMFDSKGKPVALVVDFLVAAEFLSRSVRIPWRPGVSGTVYHEPGLTIGIDRSKGVTLNGGNVTDVQWLDANRTVLAHGHQFGSSHSGDEQTYHVNFPWLDERAAEMEALIHAGYRNNR